MTFSWVSGGKDFDGAYNNDNVLDLIYWLFWSFFKEINYTLFYKHKGYKYIEAENHLENKHISSMCPGWQNSLSIS